MPPSPPEPKKRPTTDAHPYRKQLISVRSSMLQRCYKTWSHNYDNYGGRGIQVCDEWRNDLESFVAWGVRSGYEPDKGLILDRTDNDKGYSPENCRWVDAITSARNRRNNKLVEAFGESKIIAEWAEDSRSMVSRKQLTQRLWAGWNAEEAIATPVKQFGNRYRNFIPTCGTYKGYQAHRRRNEQPCQPCKTANAVKSSERRAS